MILIDGMKTVSGTCQLCGFWGLLRTKVVTQPSDVRSISDDLPDALPILPVCVTCFETPAGRKSANQDHKRLDEFEYLVKERVR